ncbi:MAG TPA: 2'-deoxycytidine 5'-triphosphate deaminase [Planctomycetes bacterium]|nr:2'-deoxycytidine 5'-triphosphate deaminase [Planctomycetota bacterium]
MDFPPGILVDHQLRSLLGVAIQAAPGADPPAVAQIQPASIDLRLGPTAHRMRAGFLPGTQSIEERLRSLSTERLSLEGEGAVLERGHCYLVQLAESLALSPDLSGRFNPRSSTGRCDLFTRVLTPGHPRFDVAPTGYRGPLWIEIAPLSFPVRVRRGDRLTQLRLESGRAALDAQAVAALHAETPLAYGNEGPLPLDRLSLDAEGAIALGVGLEGRTPCGWRAASAENVLVFSGERAHTREDFWEPLRPLEGVTGSPCLLEPESFTILASKERIRIPPTVAAEMLPVDVGIGELRNNYAGFFDPGFGDPLGSDERPGTPAVLEVRAHDVPFLVEDGQVFFRLRFFSLSARPERSYGEGRPGASYRSQDLTLARAFRAD